MTHHENLIAGTWVSGTDLSENISPSDLSDSIGHYARADAAQVDDAVCAAHDALLKWAHANPQVRAELLDAVGIAILAQNVNERLKLTRFQRLKLTRLLLRKAPSRAALT